MEKYVLKYSDAIILKLVRINKTRQYLNIKKNNVFTRFRNHIYIYILTTLEFITACSFVNTKQW